MEQVLLLTAGTEESEAYARLLGLTVGELGCPWQTVSSLPSALRAPLVLLDASHPSAKSAKETCARKGIPCLSWGWEGEEDESFLRRPVNLEAFSALCRSLLAPPPEREEKHGDEPGALLLHPVSRTASFAGEQIPLTPNEYALLSLLWENRGTPVPRERLAEAIGGALGNEVDVYLRYLRKKIDQKYDVRLLVSVRGVGYMLKGEEK